MDPRAGANLWRVRLEPSNFIPVVSINNNREERSEMGSGGFSSDHDCLSTDEEHDSDLSSVSERETDESDHYGEEKVTS